MSTALGPHRFTAEERRSYDADGYVVREAAFDLDEVATITEACETLLADLVRDRNGKRYRVGSYVFEPDMLTEVTVKWEGDTDIVHGIEPFAHLNKPLEDWAYDARFVEPMIDIVGDEHPELFTEKLNLKRPHHGGVNPLHQDWPYWQFADDRARIATAMLFLDAATLENGCLEVVPGSQARGEWTRRTDSDPFGNLELDPEAAAGAQLVPLEVPAGSVAFFGPLLVHKSNPNTSDKERRALLYSYQPAGLTHARDIVRKQRSGAST